MTLPVSGLSETGAGSRGRPRPVRQGDEDAIGAARDTPEEVLPVSPLCVTCGKAGSSKEHVWPKWIRRHATEEMGVSPSNVQRCDGSQESRDKLPRRIGVTKGNQIVLISVELRRWPLVGQAAS